MSRGVLGRAAVALSAIVLVPLVLLLVAAAIVGGGFGEKVVGVSGPLHSDAPLVMAHRGLSDAYPENSRGAFEAAREGGFEAVEIDVKRSADARYYLFHDRHSRRLLNVDIELERHTLAELQRYPLHHDGRVTDERILPLEAFAETFADDFIVYLDIKRHGDDGYERLATELAAFIERHDLERRAIVGGDFLFTSWFEYRHPALYTALGGPGDLKARAYRWIPVRFRPDFMSARLDEITPGLVDWLQRENLIERWIVSRAERADLERVEALGFSKAFVD